MARAKIGRQSAAEARFAGELTSKPFHVEVANRMEFDGTMEVTLDIQPNGAPTVDYLRLEMPLEPERAELLHCGPDNSADRFERTVRDAVGRICAVGESPIRRAATSHAKV